jgi:hypothetical protein
MRDDCGLAPLVPAKLASVVKVCADEAITIPAQNRKRMQTSFAKLDLIDSER